MSLVERFLDRSGGATPATFIKGALRLKLITKGGIAKILGVNEEQVMRLVTKSGNRNLDPVASSIASAAKQRLGLQ